MLFIIRSFCLFVISLLVWFQGAACVGPRALSAAESISEGSSVQKSRLRALVVGIDRYVEPDADPKVVERRHLRNLRGAVRDAEAMTALLVDRGYRVKSLINEEATAENIRAGLKSHLVAQGRAGDDLVFYFAGYGSHVPDLEGDELEGEDEALVPADAAKGVPDLVDDEIWSILQKVTERNIRLTVILDACFGGSAVRGPRLSGLPSYARAREAGPGTIRPRKLDKARSHLVGSPLREPPVAPNLLVLGAAQFFQEAYETSGTNSARGVFTHALLRALSKRASQETARSTFRRAAALMAADGWVQRPTIAGSRNRHEQPLFADHSRSRLHPAGENGPSVSAVVIEGGKSGWVQMEGGWTRGLREDDELVAGESRVRLDEVKPTLSIGQLVSGHLPPAGTVMKRAHMGLPKEPGLTFWWSESSLEAQELVEFERELRQVAASLEIPWIDDPWLEAPTHVLGFDEDRGWILGDRSVPDLVTFGRNPDREALRAELRELPHGSRLFVQLPLPTSFEYHPELDEPLDKHERRSRFHGLTKASEPGASHYRLVGRVSDGELLYFWARPKAGSPEMVPSPLPTRTQKVVADSFGLLSFDLRDLALKLVGVQFWQTLESSPAGRFPYRLALTREETGSSSEKSLILSQPDQIPQVSFGEKLGLALHSDQPPESIAPRYIYVLLLDSDGRRQLLYPSIVAARTENRIPTDPTAKVPKLQLIGSQPLLCVSEPPGLDTYILLTTSEPLIDPSVLYEGGVRSPRSGDHPLIKLFLNRYRGEKGPPSLPVDWSIDRLSVIVSPEGSLSSVQSSPSPCDESRPQEKNS